MRVADAADWSLSRTPGGSSGGAAAIVAVSGSPFDVGSDFGGSIRFPAHFCGVAGLKPTSFRLSNAGHFPFVPPPGTPSHLIAAFPQPGPIARWVEDLVLILPLLTGADPRDSTVREMPLAEPSTIDLKKIRVAFHVNNGIRAADSETATVIRTAADILAAQGLEVAETRPSVLNQCPGIFFVVAQPEGGKLWREELQVAGTPVDQTTSYFRSFLDIPAATSSQLNAALANWASFKASMLEFMETHDVILCPAWTTPAPAHGGARNDATAQSFTFAYNLAGWPAAVVRGGTSRSGLPIGIQIVSRPWREDIVLAVAAFLELALGGWQSVPPPQLGIRRIPGAVEMNWKGYGTLETAESAPGPWTAAPNTKSPVRLPNFEGRRFYRVRQ